MKGNNEKSNKIVIYGQVVRGLEKSSSFTEIPCVKRQLAEKFGFIPYPGTFNLDVCNEDSLEKCHEVKQIGGIQIVPQENGFCRFIGHSHSHRLFP